MTTRIPTLEKVQLSENNENISNSDKKLKAKQPKMVVTSFHSLQNITTITICDTEKGNPKNITLEHDLENISIVPNEKGNNFVLFGTIAKDQYRIFLYNPEKEKFNCVTLLSNIKDLALYWSPSGNHITYEYSDISNDYEKTIGHFSVNHADKAELVQIITTAPNISININSHLDILYYVDNKDDSLSYQIYDLTTKNLIADYQIIDRRSDFLSSDGKLLIISN